MSRSSDQLYGQFDGGFRLYGCREYAVETSDFSRVSGLLTGHYKPVRYVTRLAAASASSQPKSPVFGWALSSIFDNLVVSTSQLNFESESVVFHQLSSSWRSLNGGQLTPVCIETVTLLMESCRFSTGTQVFESVQLVIQSGR